MSKLDQADITGTCSELYSLQGDYVRFESATRNFVHIITLQHHAITQVTHTYELGNTIKFCVQDCDALRFRMCVCAIIAGMADKTGLIRPKTLCTEVMHFCVHFCVHMLLHVREGRVLLQGLGTHYTGVETDLKLCIPTGSFPQVGNWEG